MRDFYVYLHCRPDGTPFYVGKGYGKRSHFFWQRNRHHERIVAKHGAENIGVFLFPCESELQAFDDEKRWISQLRSEGYSLANVTDGGEGATGLVHSFETKQKLADAARGKMQTAKCRAAIIASRKGIPLSDAHKAKIGAANKGDVFSEEAKRNMSLAQLGKTVPAERRARISASLKAGRYKPGIPRPQISSEQRQKISASLRRWWRESRFPISSDGE